MLLSGVHCLRAPTRLLDGLVYFYVKHYLYSALEDLLSCYTLCVLLPVAYRGQGAWGGGEGGSEKGDGMFAHELLTRELVFQ